jgi:hypothetical protein
MLDGQRGASQPRRSPERHLDRWSAVTVVEDFRVALAATATDLPGDELLPERLARACAGVLPVDGAGISLFFATDRRLPLGASDEVSAEAERLQFTVGEGPCLSAHAEGRLLLADAAAIGARWPTFYAELVAHTPVRGIVSLPLQDQLAGFGALDLYLVPPHRVAGLTLPDALAVAAEVTRAFQASHGRLPDGTYEPAWLGAPAAERRALVWQAMGFLNAALRVCSTDALAMLRAHAYSRDEDLDQLARQVLAREVPVEALSWEDGPLAGS